MTATLTNVKNYIVLSTCSELSKHCTACTALHCFAEFGRVLCKAKIWRLPLCGMDWWMVQR